MLKVLDQLFFFVCMTLSKTCYFIEINFYLLIGTPPLVGLPMTTLAQALLSNWISSELDWRRSLR